MVRSVNLASRGPLERLCDHAAGPWPHAPTPSRHHERAPRAHTRMLVVLVLQGLLLRRRGGRRCHGLLLRLALDQQLLLLPLVALQPQCLLFKPSGPLPRALQHSQVLHARDEGRHPRR